MTNPYNNWICTCHREAQSSVFSLGPIIAKKNPALIPFVTASTATLRLTRLINVYNARVDAHAAFCFVQIIFHCFAVRPKCVENPTGNEAISMS